ncbi:MAG: hypothetical protein ACTSVU_05780 [Promethearchaeota archaeon]
MSQNRAFKLKILGIISVFCCVIGTLNTSAAIMPQTNSSDLPNSLEYEIIDSNGFVNFFPAGTVATEAGGKIKLNYNGDYEEWGVLQPFFNVTFYLANQTVNTTIANVSESTIGMNLILGFGGFSPNVIIEPNWTAADSEALTIANTPANESWPGMNGTLKYGSKLGNHYYNFTQNPANGTQNTYIQYNETTGILQAFESKFLDYHLKAKLNAAQFLNFETTMDIPGYPLFILVVISLISIGVGIKKNKKFIQG